MADMKTPALLILAFLAAACAPSVPYRDQRPPADEPGLSPASRDRARRAPAAKPSMHSTPPRV